MLNILGATALAYLAGSGTVTNTMVVGARPVPLRLPRLPGPLRRGGGEDALARPPFAAGLSMSHRGDRQLSSWNAIEKRLSRAGRPRPGGRRRPAAGRQRRVTKKTLARRGECRGAPKPQPLK